MDVAIVGGGICGLSLALNLKERGIACRVYERAPEIKPLGVGITLLAACDARIQRARPRRRIAQGRHRESRMLFLQPFRAADLQRGSRQICRLSLSGSRHPSRPAARHPLRSRAEAARREAVLTDCECIGVEQDERGATVHFKQTSTGKARDSVRADVVIACDGINSALRKQFYPNDKSRVLRHQHLARRDAAQADPGRPHLYARRLDPHRQDRDLSDRR